MYKAILATIFSISLVLYPVNAQAPTTDGLSDIYIETESKMPVDQVDTKPMPIRHPIDAEPTSDLTLELDLILPLAGPSTHINYTGSADAFHWKDQNSNQYNIYGVENGKFIYHEDDTWFVYGLFGQIEATKYNWNAQYDLWDGNHNGIDFATATNTPILAASGGEVTFAGISAGHTIVIKQNNFDITYGHLNSIWVEVGELITQGQIIGLSGSSGTVNPHLHFQIDKHELNGNRWGINPAKFLLPELKSAIIPNISSNWYATSNNWWQLAPDFMW